MSDEPVLRVVRGEPTPDELAAVVAVLAARATASAGVPDGPVSRSAWTLGAGIRRPLPAPGPGAWRASAGPR